MYYNEIIVVEGKNDASKLKSVYPDIECFITNGSAFEERMEELVELSKTREIILFLDPDFPGEKIRQGIMKKINCKQAFLKKSLAISKNNKKVGIEHASKEDIMFALEHALTISNDKTQELITINDLYDLNLIGNSNSQKLRNIICEKLHIGHCNSKQLVNRLNMFNISKSRVLEVLKEQELDELK